MKLKENIDISKFDCGIIIGRIQLNKPHDGHIGLINLVCKNHKKVIFFLGVPIIGNSKKNPLDFATRKAIMQSYYPDMIILPLKDNREDKLWSKNVDTLISNTFGESSALLYGSKDCFIKRYSGKYKTIEVESDIPHVSATDLRIEIAKTVKNTEDFASGIIYATYQQRSVTYPTVDVVAYNDKGELLLAKKPNESLYRFVGGFVDRNDDSYEHAAKREFAEETGNCEIDDLQYVVSMKVDDWRYKGLESGIMTTLFIGKFIFGHAAKASDDISELSWIRIYDLIKHFYDRTLNEIIMPEHLILMEALIAKIVRGGIGDLSYFSEKILSSPYNNK
jgi:bifunctional NMN adenylyltransferase/nudix hydrolase